MTPDVLLQWAMAVLLAAMAGIAVITVIGLAHTLWREWHDN